MDHLKQMIAHDPIERETLGLFQRFATERQLKAQPSNPSMIKRSQLTIPLNNNPRSLSQKSSQKQPQKTHKKPKKPSKLDDQLVEKLYRALNYNQAIFLQNKPTLQTKSQQSSEQPNGTGRKSFKINKPRYFLRLKQAPKLPKLKPQVMVRNWLVNEYNNNKEHRYDEKLLTSESIYIQHQQQQIKDKYAPLL